MPRLGGFMESIQAVFRHKMGWNLLVGMSWPAAGMEPAPTRTRPAGPAFAGATRGSHSKRIGPAGLGRRGTGDSPNSRPKKKPIFEAENTDTMGRSFEKRKHKIFGRNAKISKMFTKYGKEISMAVKAGGVDLSSNTRLRTVVQNAKGDNMPKDRIEAAIHRASSKQDADFQEVVYEGYGPHGIAIVVETATDNPTRTVANVRLYFNRAGGNLGTSGSLDFLFQRKGVFKLSAEGLNPEDLELELIDCGAEDVVLDEDMIYVYTAFEDFGAMQQGLDAKGIAVLNASTERIPVTLTELNAEQQEEIEKLIERFEEDEDVTGVFHNLG